MLTKVFSGVANRPSATRIAFDRTGEYVPGCPVGIYTINPDGTDCRQIRPSGESPRWSPDGRWIAFVEATADNGGLYSVFIMRPNGQDSRRLTFHHDVTAMPPAWSPDSKRLAYSLWLWHEKRSELCVVDIETKQWKHVTYTDDELYPVWSPSNKIMFSVYGGGKIPPLFEVDPAGQRVERCSLFEPGDREPMWTPDGNKIVFGRDEGLVIRDSSGNELQVTPARASAIQWTIAPDGERVAYTCQGIADAGFEVFIVKLSDHSILRLVRNPIVDDDHEVDSRYVSWSPWL